MPLFRRLGDILTASLNDLIDRCENPSAMLRQAIRELESHVEATLASAVEVVATEKLLARQLAEEKYAADQWRSVAAESVAANNDARARECLERSLEHDDVSAALEDQLERVALQAARLRKRAAALSAKLSEAQRRYRVLEARERAALSERATTTFGQFPACRLDRLSARLDQAEARLDAKDEVMQDRQADDFVDDRRLRRVEIALEQLKELRN